MKIEDNTHWERTPCIWIEEGGFQIDIQAEEVEIVCAWDHGYDGRGTERMTIDRKKLIELLSMIDGNIVKKKKQVVCPDCGNNDKVYMCVNEDGIFCHRCKYEGEI